MGRNVCPYLGLPDDEKTTLDFPSMGNVCHRARPAAPASLVHQTRYCLTRQHIDCPVFLAQAAGPLPAALAAPQSRWKRTRQKLRESPVLVAFLLLYLSSTVFIGARTTTQLMSLFNPPGAPISLRPSKQSTPGASLGLPGNLPPATSTPFPTPTPEPDPLAATHCPVPKGWQPYTLQPTDSLYRLSVVYGVSVEALQKANCLGNQTVLAPGAVLFAPALNPLAASTATPSAAARNAAPARVGISGATNNTSVQVGKPAAPTQVKNKDSNPGNGNDKGKNKEKGKKKGNGKGKHKGDG